MRQSSILRAVGMTLLLICLSGCQTCKPIDPPDPIEILASIQNPTQVANDIWTKLLANHFTNETRVHTFSFTNEPVWNHRPGNEIRRRVYKQAKRERHVRVVRPQDAKYILGVAITDELEGKKVVFTLTTVGREGALVVHTTILDEPDASR